MHTLPLGRSHKGNGKVIARHAGETVTCGGVQ